MAGFALCTGSPAASAGAGALAAGPATPAAVLPADRAGAPMTLPTEIDLPVLLALARQVSPRIALAEHAVSAAQADRITAGAYRNPVLGYGRVRPRGGDRTIVDADRQDDIGIEFPLMPPGQRRVRLSAADADIATVRAEVQVARAELVVEAGAAFVELLAAQERSAILGAASAELERLREVVAGRQRGGLASRYDLTRIEVELGGWHARALAAQAEVADAAARLAALLGLPQWRPHATGKLAPLPDGAGGPPTRQESADARTADHPAVLAAQRREQAAAAEVVVARSERWPDMSVNLGRSRTSGPYGAANYVGLSIELPLFDTRRGAFERARAEAHAAALNSAIVRAETTIDRERHGLLVERHRDALTEFQARAGERLPELRGMAQDAYVYGQGAIVELLDAVRTDFELRLTRIELVAALLESQLRLRAAQGLLR